MYGITEGVRVNLIVCFIQSIDQLIIVFFNVLLPDTFGFWYNVHSLFLRIFSHCARFVFGLSGLQRRIVVVGIAGLVPFWGLYGKRETKLVFEVFSRVSH